VGLAGLQVGVGEWVKTGRKADRDVFVFLELNDESCLRNLQVIVNAVMAALSSLVPTNTCGGRRCAEAASCWDQAEDGASGREDGPCQTGRPGQAETMIFSFYFLLVSKLLGFGREIFQFE
jgi:hypothetical protein